jgi:putative thioredoxin
MADSPYIIDVTAETFESVVLEGSLERPVLVDFWAGWCQPCQMLMPMLARLAEEYAGAFLLAKVDTEAQQALAMQWGIRSLPTVKLFRNGGPVDEFMGVQPEEVIRAILDGYVERASDALRTEAMGLHRAGRSEQAIALLRKAAAEDPANPRVSMDLLNVMVEAGQLDAAQALITQLPASLQAEPEIKGLGHRIEFARSLEGAPSRQDLEAALASDPDDLEARYQLAARHVQAGEYEPAMEALLSVLQRDRSFREGAARTGLLAIFDMLGGEGDLVKRYRARMFNALH